MGDAVRRGAATISLGFGRGRVDFAFDPARFDILDAGGPEERALDDAALAARLDDPIGSPPLAEIVRPGHRVCVVVPDATRASGSNRVAPLLLARLNALSVPDSRVEFLVGGGTHRAPTAGEIARIVGDDVARRVAIHAHDAFDAAAHVALGTTERGTPVEINRRLVDADHVVLVGAIGFHYFAGFSGGRKGLLPGCGSDPAIQRNHLLGFDRATLRKADGVESGRLDGNPVSEDMEACAALFGPSYLVNTVVDGAGRVTRAYTGHWRAAHRAGCGEYRAAHSIGAPERRDVVVVSCGGAPRDLNVIQSHKALEHARVVLNDGGDLVLLAECSEGLGRDDFLEWFVPGGSESTARKLVDNYRINGQTAWGIRWKSERYRVRLVSGLDPETVRRMGMIPCETLDEAMAAIPGGRGYIVPRGIATLPVLDEARVG
ncbi:MAG: nickel-dependent lactate racemase [Acidobacteria bacterium]|nr:nickel-dependent lactate racemase [Acidobacteriota bacterium]